MREYNFKTDSFKQFLKEKEAQINVRTENEFSSSENFKELHRCLISYHTAKPIQDFTAVLITKVEINNLSKDFSTVLFGQLDSEIGVVNNHLLFDRSMEIISYERKELKDNNDARKFYLEASNNTCVFLINPKGVHYFVDGKDIGESIFFSSDAYMSINELKDISKLFEIFDEYRQHLCIRNTYTKFFVSKSAKSSLCKHIYVKATPEIYESFIEEHKQLLENKPEDIFREDLRIFLRNKLKATVLGKEYILDNFKRLDIFINDDFGELYLIEVKWVGVSIHQHGQKIGTSYDENSINPSAVCQSVNYIKQLNEENKNIKLGYLAVFDARYNELPDTVENFDENILGEELKKFYSRFKKIPDFKVVNAHPQ